MMNSKKREIFKLTVFHKWIDCKYLVEIAPNWDQSINHPCPCQLQTLSMHYLRVLERDVLGRKDIISKVDRTNIFFTIRPSLQLSLKPDSDPGKICTDTPLWQTPQGRVSACFARNRLIGQSTDWGWLDTLITLFNLLLQDFYSLIGQDAVFVSKDIIHRSSSELKTATNGKCDMTAVCN